MCGRQLLPTERHLCLCCEADLPLTHFEDCSRNPMADRYNARLVDAGCGDSYQYATSLFYYGTGSGYDYIPQALKYGRNFGAGRHFARMLGGLIAGAEHFRDVDLVTCVPLHWTRRYRRGYNQAAVIASEIARALQADRAGLHEDRAASSPLGVRRTFDAASGRAEPAGTEKACDAASGQAEPAGMKQACDAASGQGYEAGAGRVLFDPWLLRRTRRTATQTRLSVEAKALNVSGAFAVRRHYLPPSPTPLSFRAQPRNLLPRHILLVDDVFTTGSTLSACAKALFEAFGPEVRVSIATLACVPQR